MQRTVLALGLALGLGSIALSQDAPRPAKVGVVDLAAAFKGYRRTTALEVRINAEREELKARRDGEDDPEAKRVLERDLERTLRARWEAYNKAILADIERAVEKIGGERDFDAIAQKEVTAASGMTLKALLFVRGGTPEEVTEAVIDRLNADYTGKKEEF